MPFRRLKFRPGGYRVGWRLFRALVAWLFWVPVHAAAQDTETLSRGAYLARIGDCIACHTAGSGSEPYAGGLPIQSPFGVIYSTNITPDPEYGIGDYSLEDFERAVRHGIRRDGARLYPAMPYPSFAAITDDDIQTLYGYFMHEVAPVRRQGPQTRLPFPFNFRFNLILWNWAFTGQRPFNPHPGNDAAWNRGAYLVRTLGHCGACHTPRGLAFQEKAYTETSPWFLSGAVVDNWYAQNLRGDPASGLGRWSENEIANFLKFGHSNGGTAFGSMNEVIENSMQYLRDDDLQAIARYLKSLPPRGEKAAYRPDDSANAVRPVGLHEIPGAGLYAGFCAKCHRAEGSGKPGRYPKLAGNSSVLSDNPVSLIRLMLQGGEPPRTQANLKPHKMPSFAAKFTDAQIAEALTFVRNSWGNRASPVTPRMVETLRNRLRSAGDAD